MRVDFSKGQPVKIDNDLDSWVNASESALKYKVGTFARNA
jgi:hypothetical protein